MAKALIVGSAGQDGRYLHRFLLVRGYSVIGFDRDGLLCGMPERANIDATQLESIGPLIGDLQPDEVYYLAAYHHSSEDRATDDHGLIGRSFETNTLGPNSVLQAIARFSPRSRLFYASSSRVFGQSSDRVHSELTPISKHAGMQLCRYYRQRRNVHASSGILFNHESPLRSPKFASKKIVGAAVRIGKGSQEKLLLGDLGAFADWGFAGDFVRAIWHILQLPTADDFVVGTGELHSVEDFVQTAFSILGLDWTRHVVRDPSLLDACPPNRAYCADAAKLRRLTGWKPRVSFTEMIQRMIEAETDDRDPTTDPRLYSDLQ